MKYEKYDQVEIYISSKFIWVEGIIINLFSKNGKTNYKVEYLYNNTNYTKNITQKNADLYLKLIQKHYEFMSSNNYNGEYWEKGNEFASVDDGLKKSDCGNYYICYYFQ